jgi:hypothetical protein
MNITKSPVTGVDIPIQKLQSYLYPLVKGLWGLGDSTYNAYGRAYRNQTEDGYSPEVYTGLNEYKDVYQDDTLSASSFFGVGEVQTVKASNQTADVFLIFMVDLSKIKPGATRNDEEAHIDIENLCKPKNFEFTFTGLVTGIDQVFKEYSGWKKKEGIKYRDMHPQHCFRLNFKLLYNIYDCMTPLD